MTVTHITTGTPACLGIGCPLHADCLRYRLAVVDSEGGEV